MLQNCEDMEEAGTAALAKVVLERCYCCLPVPFVFLLENSCWMSFIMFSSNPSISSVQNKFILVTYVILNFCDPFRLSGCVTAWQLSFAFTGVLASLQPGHKPCFPRYTRTLIF